MRSERRKFDILDWIVNIALVIIFVVLVSTNPHKIFEIGIGITVTMIIWGLMRVMRDN